MRGELDGWGTRDRRDADGAVEAVQAVRAVGPLVEPTEAAARSFGRGYWREVARSSRRLVRCRETAAGVELHVPLLGLVLLRFAPLQVTVDPRRVACTYAILGGVLTREAGGVLCLSQEVEGQAARLEIAVRGFRPRLRLLYPLERRFHASVSRSYFGRLLRPDGQ